MEKYSTGHCKVYLMSFKKDGKSYIKPGITDYKDVYSRIQANLILEQQSRPDRVPWVRYFDTVKVLKSITVENKEKALMIEEEILNALGPKDVTFDQNFSGITEVRKYSSQQYATAVSILESYRVKY